MNKEEIINEFIKAGALLEGHFELSSGLHSAKYIQCAKVMMDHYRAEKLCKELAKKIMANIKTTIDIVVSPAMGGVLVGYEVARQLNLPSIFFERVNGQFELRRGFEIKKGFKCLMVEDIITTGLSSNECISAIKEHGGEVIGTGCLIDRSMGKADIGFPIASLTQIYIETYDSNNVPDWLSAIAITKPGSRKIK